MKLFKSLRARLLLLVLIAVIPAIGVTLSSGLQQRALARSSAEDDAYRYTRLVAFQEASLIEGARQLLYSLSLSPEIQQVDRCNELFTKLRDVYPMYTAMSVAREDGIIYCSSLPSAIGTSVADRKYFQTALENKAFTIGQGLTSGKVTKKPIIPITLPLLNTNREVNGLLIVTLDLSSTSTFVDSLNLPAKSAMLIVNEDGTILMRHPEAEGWIGQKILTAPIIQQILSQAKESSAEVEGVDGVYRLYAFTPLSVSSLSSTYVSVGIPSDVAYASANAALQNNLLWLGGIALFALAVAWFGGEIFFLRVVSLTAERDEAERKLREINAGLEERVSERTAELAKANGALHYELAERKKALEALNAREAELKELLQVLERSNKDLQDFAYIASHDLQEPLRKIQAFGDRLAKRYTQELGEEGQDFIQRMNTSANRMQAMINDLLAYSRVNTQSKEYRWVNLNEVIQGVLSDLEIRIQETHAKIEMSDLPTIEANEPQMRQLFQNLIANSLKFRQPDLPPVIKISGSSMKSEAWYEEEMVSFTVQDNGIGFDEKYTEKIFQPFQRLHSKNEYEGSGIGLAICRKIAERHRGKISARSKVNSGSCFTVILPIRQKKKGQA